MSSRSGQNFIGNAVLAVLAIVIGIGFLAVVSGVVSNSTGIFIQETSSIDFSDGTFVNTTTSGDTVTLSSNEETGTFTSDTKSVTISEFDTFEVTTSIPSGAEMTGEITVDGSTDTFALSDGSNSFSISSEGESVQTSFDFVASLQNVTVGAFDISTASFLQSTSFSGTTTSGTVEDMVWDNSGSRMYLLIANVSAGTSSVQQYGLSDPFNVSTATFTQEFSTSGTAGGTATGIDWNDDGTNLLVVTSDNNALPFDASTPFDVSTLSWDGSGFGSLEGGKTDFVWDNTGDFGFTTDEDGKLARHPTGSPYDLTGGADQEVSITSVNNILQGISFNNDGTRIYVLSNATGQENLSEYSMSTAFDLTTLSFVRSLDISAQETLPTGTTWNDTGTSLYISGQSNDEVHQWSVGTQQEIVDESPVLNDWSTSGVNVGTNAQLLTAIVTLFALGLVISVLVFLLPKAFTGRIG